MTYLDSGVLLAAWKPGQFHDAAMLVLSQDHRSFVTSQAVRLELLPKPAFERRRTELEFYHRYFAEAESDLPLNKELADEAQKLAERHGLAALDALHIAAAIRQGANEFITSELPGKPIFRVAGIKVVSLHKL
ncbi:MAG: type II toxin-antitoxin system VapC family toxin [Limisphaerales bacterium]